MPKIRSLRYWTRQGDQRVLEFHDGNIDPGFQMTLLTGQNGSQKSSVLRDLVSAIVLPTDKANVTFQGVPGISAEAPVICFSGSVADRFPQKMIGGRNTEYDVPNYHYIGQRAGTNLLSKKLPLETAVTFALNPAVRDRFLDPFFEKAFSLSGLDPSLSLEIRYEQRFKKRFPSITPREILERALSGLREPKSRGEMSLAAAQSVREEFSDFDFDVLTSLIDERKGRFSKITLSKNSAVATQENLAVRLGLMLDILVIDRATVRRDGEEEFSVYELSSGEYHMLTSLLALGFSVTAGSIVLVDEPENSLHPHWQQEFMATLLEICGVMEDGHLVVSTHSPLIVASAKPGSMIVDLTVPREVIPAQPAPFGASSDSILLDQFGIASSRNLYVVELVQQAVDLVERDLAGTAEYEALRPKLRDVLEALQEDDPLRTVIGALLEGEGRE
ncbi:MULTISPECIES: ATP-binding protein [Agrobacterium]|uniref:ATP-binding protein n=1 Tax=Agrobacterium tumefaciens TaxID=358 RepID=UPI001573FF62|nr:AAA family ATPase [Agrobacterium tumefaciens]